MLVSLFLVLCFSVTCNAFGMPAPAAPSMPNLEDGGECDDCTDTVDGTIDSIKGMIETLEPVDMKAPPPCLSCKVTDTYTVELGGKACVKDIMGVRFETMELKFSSLNTLCECDIPNGFAGKVKATLNAKWTNARLKLALKFVENKVLADAANIMCDNPDPVGKCEFPMQDVDVQCLSPEPEAQKAVESVKDSLMAKIFLNVIEKLFPSIFTEELNKPTRQEIVLKIKCDP